MQYHLKKWAISINNKAGDKKNENAICNKLVNILFFLIFEFLFRGSYFFNSFQILLVSKIWDFWLKMIVTNINSILSPTIST